MLFNLVEMIFMDHYHNKKKELQPNNVFQNPLEEHTPL